MPIKESIFQCLYMKAYFYVYIGRPMSMPIQEILFPYLSRKACFHVGPPVALTLGSYNNQGVHKLLDIFILLVFLFSKHRGLSQPPSEMSRLPRFHNQSRLIGQVTASNPISSRFISLHCIRFCQSFIRGVSIHAFRFISSVLTAFSRKLNRVQNEVKFVSLLSITLFST